MIQRQSKIIKYFDRKVEKQFLLLRFLLHSICNSSHVSVLHLHFSAELKMSWMQLHFSSFLIGMLLLAPAWSGPLTSTLTPTSTASQSPCSVSPSGLSANCLGRQLQQVPWSHFPSTLEKIDLSYNRLQAVDADDFRRLPRLRVLLLQFNNISHIHSEAFRENRLLEHLNIFNNSLEEIPTAALEPLVNLKQLYMSNNLYRSAKLDQSFSRFLQLQVLSMGGPLVESLRKDDFQPLKNIRLMGFAIKCSSNLSFFEAGSLKVIQTRQMGFDMALDQRPGALLQMLSDIANKTFSVVQFRNLFEFTYYTGRQDLFQGLRDVTAHQLIFHRGKFNENLLRMALLNLQGASIKRLRLQYIDFARSPTFVDSGASSSVTDLELDNLDLW